MIKRITDTIKSILRFIGNLALSIVLLVILYFIAAVIFTIIPSNPFAEQPEKGIAIYIKTNGVHTDIVVPSVTKFYNWDEKIRDKDFFIDTTNYTWTSFGWGDKGFYLDTPSWSELKVSTAFNAMFIPSPTAMHVSLYEDRNLAESKTTRKIILTESQYLILCDFIFKSFQKNDQENFMQINCCDYPNVTDTFYEANGSYHLFDTCNNWSNSALKAAGVKTAFWAPFDKCIFYHF